ncbi:hypothetical protein D3C73_1243370 [compost metagenome]
MERVLVQGRLGRAGELPRGFPRSAAGDRAEEYGHSLCCGHCAAAYRFDSAGCTAGPEAEGDCVDAGDYFLSGYSEHCSYRVCVELYVRADGWISAEVF